MTVREQQVRALYRAALERPAAERTSFVADLTGDDLDLRKSVELLLSRHDGATQAGERTAKMTAGEELPAGTLVAHYRIEGVIARGGMGIVYGATDQKLQRPVAIKFLAAAVPDEQTSRRFKQEAATTSGLNHPHIVTVFDVGQHDGQQYIVSELVDGGTLDDWAERRRGRAWRQTVELLTGVADALAAAHAAGVLHRDVKPGNILIGSNGYAKLADFGLAKFVGREQAPARESAHNTRAGLVVGTVAYMSPEQAAGETLDARSDVFSFGVVLYELLAGRRAFEGANELETLKAIANAAPAVLPESVPEPLQALVDKALEKAPGDRYQTMQDLVVDLKRLARKHSSALAAGSVTAAGRRTRRLALATAGLGVAFLALLVPALSHWLEPLPVRPKAIRFDVPVPGLLPNGLAVAPDGQTFAYAATDGGARRIWLRSLDSLLSRVLPTTEDAQAVFWSPDGDRLAFIADRKLKTIDVRGGPATAVADYGPQVVLYGAWTEAGSLIVTMANTIRGTLGLGRVPAVGGTPVMLREPNLSGAELGLTAPRALPNGQGILYLGGRPDSQELTLYAARLEDGDAVRLTTIDAAMVPAGILPGVGYGAGFVLYRRDRTLFAQRFDAAKLAFDGAAVPIAEDVGEFAVADSLLVYRTAIAPAGGGPAAPPTRRLSWVDRTGQKLGELEAPPQFRLPVLSPDERTLAVSVGAPPATDVWMIDARRGATTRLTTSRGVDDIGAWSPDSTRIAFNSDRDGVAVTPSGMYLRAANGTGAEDLLLKGGNDEILVPFDWSPDGRYLVFGRAGIATWQDRIDLWLLEMTGERTAAPLIQSSSRKETAKFSPDGRWLAYSSTENGGHEIFVQPFPDLGRGKWQVSTRGGREPRWRGDGKELFYLDPDGNLMSVELGIEGDRFEPGQPQQLFNVGFPLPAPNTLPNYFYAVTADAQRFLINEPLPDSAGTPLDAAGAGASTPVLHVIVNWAEELGR